MTTPKIKNDMQKHRSKAMMLFLATPVKDPLTKSHDFALYEKLIKKQSLLPAQHFVAIVLITRRHDAVSFMNLQNSALQTSRTSNYYF